MDMLVGKAVEKLLFLPQGRLSHSSGHEELLFQLNRFFVVVFFSSKRGAVSIFIVAALLKQKHCAVSMDTMPYVG